MPNLKWLSLGEAATAGRAATRYATPGDVLAVTTGGRAAAQCRIDRTTEPLSMAKLTKIQRAFLAGVRYGRRLAGKETRRDVEEAMDELADADEEVRTLRAIDADDGMPPR